MEIQKSAVVFSIDKPMKQSNPRNAIRPLILEAFLPDKALCVYNVLLEYISRTESIQGVEHNCLLVAKNHIRRYHVIQSADGLEQSCNYLD